MAFALIPGVAGNDWCTVDVHGYNCVGNDIGHVTGITAHIDCCNACTTLSGCTAWTWHYPTQDCYLKSSCNNVSSSDEYHSSQPLSPSPAPAPSPPSPSPAGTLGLTGRCGLAITDGEAAAISNGNWLASYGGSVGFWYNWDGHTSVTVQANGKVVPYVPMWWGSQVWSQHSAQTSWCSDAGHSSIPAEAGTAGVAFAWNEPIGGSSCTYSMGACSGGDYSGTSGATQSAQNYAGCVDGAKAANRLVSTPCLNNLDPAWLRAWRQSSPTQSQTVCCSHLYASQFNDAGWESCDWNAMTNMDKLAGQLQGLKNDGTCDYHFIQEIGIGGCKTADHWASEKLLENLGNAVRNIPSVYLGWFANSAGAGDTARSTTWPFQENVGTVGKAYQAMCASLMTTSANESSQLILV